MTEASSGASIEVRNAVKRYDEVTAIDGISLDIRAGEFLTLLGPSGSGKTTTLNAIAGFVELTDGEIDLDGATDRPDPPHKRNIGVIFQDYALFPHMTAASNVAYALKQRRVPREERDERVQKSLDLVGLGDVGRRYPNELSGGQQQRVALARAIVFNPQVLLMDEPLGALDSSCGRASSGNQAIHREIGITFIYVTHDQEEALALSDRIAVFNDGRSSRSATQRTSTRGRATASSPNSWGSPTSSTRSRRLPYRSTAAHHPVHRRSPRGVRPPDAGQVADISYLGSSRRVIVESNGTSVLVREDAHAAAPIGLGEDVQLGWNSGDAMLIRDGEGK